MGKRRVETAHVRGCGAPFFGVPKLKGIPTEIQNDPERIKAVQYVRMSMPGQRHSLAYQAAAIEEYAERRGYEITTTYFDSGKSGLSLKGRFGLQQLLVAALRPDRAFDAILVFDISRWGRFQDPDQSAHYEYICRQAGLTVAYCAEPFENTISPMATIAKHLKRVMAAEYSRELSEKLSRAHLQQANLGFKQGGRQPYGFRRMLIDEHGQPRGILGLNQYKALSDDHVITVPGPANELVVIRKIFRWFVVHEMCPKAIAARLQADGVAGNLGRPFTSNMVRTVLTSEHCIGHYVYNRTTKKLQSPTRKNPEKLWVRVRTSEPIVSVKLFRKAQEILVQSKGKRLSRKKMLRALRRLLKQKGYLSRTLITRSPLTPNAQSYVEHFGSLTTAYARIGWIRPQWSPVSTNGAVWTEDSLVAALKRLYRKNGCLSVKLIDEDPKLPSARFVRKRLGSLCEAYRRCGFRVYSHSDIMQKVGSRYRSRLAATVKPGSLSKPRYTRKDIIAGLKRILDQHGYISARLIGDAPDLPGTPTIQKQFGSLPQAYRCAGWSYTPEEIMARSAQRRVQKALTSVLLTGETND